MMRFSAIVFILFAYHFLFAQSNAVVLSANTKTIGVNDVITFTVKTTLEGEIRFDFPKNFQVSSGISSGLEEEVNYKTGVSETIYSFSQFGNFTQEGEYKIRAYIQGEKTSKSNEVKIQVLSNTSNAHEIPKSSLRKKAFGIIDLSKNQVYEGEPVVVTAKNYSKYPITLVESYLAYNFKAGVQRFPLDKSKKLITTKEEIRGKAFYVFNYGKQLIFANQVGEITIDPFEINYRHDNGKLYSEKVHILSSKAKLHVMPLPSPAPADFIGAVGNYSFKLDLPKKEVQVNEMFDLELLLTGTGNLHTVKFPTLKLPPDFIVLGNPDVEEDFSYGINGVEGVLKYIYHIQAVREGKLQIPSISISYFNPTERKYKKLKQKGLEITCTQHAEIKQNNTQENTLTGVESVLNNGLKKESKPTFLTSAPFIVTSVSLFSTAFLFLFLFLKKKAGGAETEQMRKSKVNWEQIQIELQEKITDFIATEKDDEVFTNAPKLLFEATRIASRNDQLIASKNEIKKAVSKLNPALTETVESIWNNCEVGRYGYMNTEKLYEDTKKATLDYIEKLELI